MMMTMRSIVKGLDRRLLATTWGNIYSSVTFAVINLANPYLLFACSKALRQKLISIVRIFKAETFQNTVTPLR